MLRSYSQVLFSRSPWVGLAILAATFIEPRVGTAGLAAVVVSVVLARLLAYPRGRLREGMYGYNALLIGLGGGALFSPEPRTLGVLVLAVCLGVMLHGAALSTMTDRSAVPPLTLPFVITFSLLLLVAPWLQLPTSAPSPGDLAAAGPVPAFREGLTELGGLFFVRDPRAGALIALALLVHSRIAAVLVGLGLLVSMGLASAFVPEVALGTRTAIVINGTLTTLALGGVFFVPGYAAFSLALLGTGLSFLLTLAVFALLVPLALPPLILPFNAAVLLVLLSLRQRQHDRSPKAVDFLPGTPEQNLRYFRMRLARFGARYGVRFGLPFRGRWVCTQAVGGEPTHQGAFRHALDFEVSGEDGRLHRDEGQKPADYYCYRLPVLAAADGTVASVMDGVPDNPVGTQNLKQSWGNVVVLAHGFGLFSLVAHLAPLSIQVRPGQFVRKGEVLALSGSSGRSPRPHLHFQLQATPQVGSATLPLDLADVVREVSPDKLVLTPSCVPAAGDQIRRLGAGSETSTVLGLEVGESLRFRIAPDQEETIVREVDAQGRSLLRSTRYGTRLFFEQEQGLFTAVDLLGDPRSGLRVVAAAVARLPLEADARLEFSDYLPLRDLLPAWLRPVSDAFAPLFPGRGVRILYTFSRQSDGITLQGRGTSNSGRAPRVATSARFNAELSLQEASLRVGTQERRVTRLAVSPSPPSGEKPKPALEDV